MTKKKKTVLLIDGDVFVYQIGLAAEKETDWGDGLWTLHADFDECREHLRTKIDNLVKTLEADEVRFALSCSTETGFRRELCPTYKSNRVGKRKPIVHKPLRELLLSDYDTILRDRLEADDVLGLLSTQPVRGERRIIVSVDKDYSGVPGLFYRTNTDHPRVDEVTSDSARRFHALQTLMGDRTDGYVGIPGCGPKSAEKILADVPTADLWPTIVKAYADAGLGEELALTNARLAHILQWGDYDTKTGVVKLWTPKQISQPA
jgi:DNA polymerase-1